MFHTVCDNMLKTMSFRDDCQAGMSTAEVMTVVLTAACFFCGNTRAAACFLREHGHMPDMLSGSRLNRRIQSADESAWENLFLTFADIFKAAGNGEHITDSFPVPVCVSIRIPRAKILRGPEGPYAFRAAVFLRNTGSHDHDRLRISGRIVMAPGRDSDVAVLRQMISDLPDGSVCHGDKICDDHICDDMLR